MKVKINLNEEVKVKLTDRGIMILKDQYDELNRKIKSSGGKGMPFELKLDEEGYYKDQLWSIFQKFGKHIGLALEPPFETEMLMETKS